MADEKKVREITRITLGGLEQIPGLVGSEDDYSFMGRITFRGQRDRKTIMAVNLGSIGAFYNVSDYDSTEEDSFLGALDEVLEIHGWYLAYCGRKKITFWYGHQIVTGDLYAPKNKLREKTTPKN